MFVTYCWGEKIIYHKQYAKYDPIYAKSKYNKALKILHMCVYIYALNGSEWFCEQ